MAQGDLARVSHKHAEADYDERIVPGHGELGKVLLPVERNGQKLHRYHCRAEKKYRSIP
jgi:hypothetical protein